jgi:hypothetical protein
MKKIIILIMIMMVIFSCTNTIVEDKDSKDSPETYVPFVPVDPNPVIVNQQIVAGYQPALNGSNLDQHYLDLSSITGGQAFVSLLITDSYNVDYFCNYVIGGINNINGSYIYYFTFTNAPIRDDENNIVTQILTDEQGRILIWGGSTTQSVWYYATVISYIK